MTVSKKTIDALDAHFAARAATKRTAKAAKVAKAAEGQLSAAQRADLRRECQAASDRLAGLRPW